MICLNSVASLSAFHVSRLLYPPSILVPISIRNYAARKGTRERKLKKKVKTEVKKIGFIPHNQRNKEKSSFTNPMRIFDETSKKKPIDDVYINKFYRWTVYSFADAVNCHKETHHSTMYNKPDASLNVNIELNMNAAKKDKYVENFNRIVTVPHKFQHGDTRSIIIFTKQSDIHNELREMGANLVGGIELIKDVENGAISLHDFQHLLAEPSILPEIAKIRGLIPKRKYPNPRNGTLTSDLKMSLDKFLHGVSYSAVKNEHQQNYGLIETSIGSLSMDINQLEENFACLVQDVNRVRPIREGLFITRCLLLSPPSREKVNVDFSKYLLSNNSNSTNNDDDDDEDDDEDVASATAN